MDAPLSDRLLPWIAVPLVLLAVVVALALSLPEVRCDGEESEGGIDGAILVAVVALSAVAAVGAGLFRLVTMAFRNQLGWRDGWILLAALLVIAVAAVGYAPVESFGAGLAIGCLVVTALALLVLVAAAAARWDADAVGILLPIYLFGAAYVYLGVGAIGLLVSSGIGC